MRARLDVVVAGLATMLLTASCGGGPTVPTQVHGAGPTPLARRPVLADCPLQGGPSSLPRVRLACLGHGPEVDTSTLGGRPIMINLWASWCVPCQREMPALQAAYHRYGDQVTFLGVDTEDSVDSANDFLAAVGVHYPQVVDDGGDLLHKVGGAGLPVTMVLDRDGARVFTKLGQLRGRDLEKALAAAGVRSPKA